jgi:hypothetical protein
MCHTCPGTSDEGRRDLYHTPSISGKLGPRGHGPCCVNLLPSSSSSPRLLVPLTSAKCGSPKCPHTPTQFGELCTQTPNPRRAPTPSTQPIFLNAEISRERSGCFAGAELYWGGVRLVCRVFAWAPTGVLIDGVLESSRMQRKIGVPRPVVICLASGRKNCDPHPDRITWL